MGVIERLKKYILVEGFHVVVDVDKSHSSWIVDAESGKEYLDCYSQYASQALGWNYPAFKQKDLSRLHKLSECKLANSDMYSQVYCEFVESFAQITPDFKHYFFIEGGALAVENSLKAAFDWKCQMNPSLQSTWGDDMDVIHLSQAFHGRAGYTLSMSNTGEVKTRWFPQFNWSRVGNPSIKFPVNETEIQYAEEISLTCMRMTLKNNKVAAIILEPIQAEGGDNHFRPQFLREVRKLADEHEAMLIFDEVQSGMGLTGKWWAYEHMDVKPDLLCFGKKSQVCGFCANERIDLTPKNVFTESGRINSTWGGNIVDMERARLIIEVIREQKLVENAAEVGAYFLDLLRELAIPTTITNVRGRGLMIAFDLPTARVRDFLLQRLIDNGLLALECGERSIRFRPALTFSKEDVDMAIFLTKKSLN